MQGSKARATYESTPNFIAIAKHERVLTFISPDFDVWVPKISTHRCFLLLPFLRNFLTIWSVCLSEAFEWVYTHTHHTHTVWQARIRACVAGVAERHLITNTNLYWKWVCECVTANALLLFFYFFLLPTCSVMLSWTPCWCPFRQCTMPAILTLSMPASLTLKLTLSQKTHKNRYRKTDT